MHHFTVPQPGLDVPAWFGKLPGMGDFAQRRLAPHFLERWDLWLQQGLQQLRLQREDWLSHYLEAPLWYFALGQDLLSERPWIGVIMPSVDAVGRYFPLTLAIELEHTSEGVMQEHMQCMAQWWGRSAQAALAALDADFDGARFDASLHTLFSQAPLEAHRAPVMESFPAQWCSSWFANVGEPNQAAYALHGLPTGDAFGVLFGFADEPSVQR